MCWDWPLGAWGSSYQWLWSLVQHHGGWCVGTHSTNARPLPHPQYTDRDSTKYTSEDDLLCHMLGGGSTDNRSRVLHDNVYDDVFSRVGYGGGMHPCMVLVEGAGVGNLIQYGYEHHTNRSRHPDHNRSAFVPHGDSHRCSRRC